MKCSQCGAKNREGTNFCGSCGANLIQQPPQNKENNGKQKMPTWAKVLSVILALVILVTGSLVVFNVIPLSNSVKVPYVIGETKTSAKEILLKKKLFILVVGKKDSENDIAKNLICEQIPGKGTKLEKNSAVSVYLSNGPEMGYMPEIVYHTLDSAKEKIDEQGLGVQIAYEQSDEVAKNGVIKQETASETPVQQGKTVKITVSEGSDKPTAGKYTLPNIVGMDFNTARTELLKNGVYLLINETKFDDNIPKNQIMVQDKASGTTVNKGETVYVTISLGKETVRVPDVTYLDKDEAVSTFEALGLTVNESEGNDPDVNENLILAQSAEAGTLLEKGAEITLTVNKWEDDSTSTGDEIVTEPQTNSLEATDEDFEILEKTLSAYWYGGFGEIGNIREPFDLEKLSTGSLIENYIIDAGVFSGLYKFFYNETPETFESTENSAYITYRVNADKSDWIIKNVFEKTPDRSLSSDGEFRRYHYDNDYLYLSGIFERGEPHSYQIIEKYRLKDETYGIAVLEYNNVGYDTPVYLYYSNVNYYVAKLKEDKDMGRYWCILKGTQNERCFDLPDGATDKTTIFTEYTNAMTQRLKDHKSTLYTEEYELLEYSYYTLYDINGDGIKELIVNPADSEAGSMYYFYTFKDNKAVYCGSLSAGHSKLSVVNGKLYKYWSHEFNRIDYIINLENDKINETKTFEKYYGSSDNYEAPEGEYIEMSSSQHYTELVKKLLLK